jgi:predicted N-formylglutamate amidohydrolase
MPRAKTKTTRKPARPKRAAAPELALVLSCEHGGNAVPAEYRALFKGAKRALASHRGWDPGALDLARALARALDAPLVATTTSRLVVECNRSLTSRQLFSEFTKGLPRPEKKHLLDSHYHPHRGAVEAVARSAIRSHGAAVHVGVHSFTPVMGGRLRDADIGLLYDPRRPAEAVFCELWTIALARIAPELHVRRNYPYRGWSDGLTTALRAALPPARYLGIELEVNQALVAMSAAWARTRSAIAESLALVLGG